MNLNWKIEFTPNAEKCLKKIDKPIAKRIYSFLKEHIMVSSNPRETGKALKGNMRNYWRYRVGDYRIICSIKDDTVTVLVVHIGHRGNVYTLKDINE